MPNTGDCPLEGLSAEECKQKLQYLESTVTQLEKSVGLLLENRDTDSAQLKQLRHQVDMVKVQVQNVERLLPLIESFDNFKTSVHGALGQVLEVQGHILEQIGNGRGGK